MTRRRFTRWAGVSGLWLLVATLILEAVSSVLGLELGRGGVHAGFRNGLLGFGTVTPGSAMPPGWSFDMHRHWPPYAAIWPRDGLYSLVGNQGIVFRFWYLPIWLLAAPGLALWLFGSIGSGRTPGCCPRCGYNLAGTPSGVCPECGARARAEEPRAPSAGSTAFL